ncbi:hypothetical protein GCM10023338_04260 [Wohlfahrtiimonas larvae]|uniref:Uncharacterized protein n=1 Tax=Wohlfahrtiimonas larvae TaxID=1157986 RepID=A0ABP9MDQ1_9GAMM
MHTSNSEDKNKEKRIKFFLPSRSLSEPNIFKPIMSPIIEKEKVRLMYVLETLNSLAKTGKIGWKE